MFCAGQRTRIQDSLGGGCVFLLRDDHFRSLRGPGFDPHFFPQFGKGPRYFLGDALLFQDDALSLSFILSFRSLQITVVSRFNGRFFFSE